MTFKMLLPLERLGCISNAQAEDMNTACAKIVILQTNELHGH